MSVEVDTIVARATGAGPAAISVVRVSGPRAFEVIARVDTPIEVHYLRNGGILHYVLHQMAK